MQITQKTLLAELVDYYTQHVTPREVRFMQAFSALRRFRLLSLAFRLATRLGDGPAWWLTAILLLAMGETYWLAIPALGLAIGISVCSFMLLKRFISRPRPFEVWADLHCLMFPPDRFSFPSGHTMTAFSVCGVVAVWTPGLLPGYLLLAVLIGLSRVFLGLHYPTDVLVGALLGWSVGLAAGRLIWLAV